MNFYLRKGTGGGSQKPHESYFRTQGFEIVRAWSLYLKMKKRMKKNENVKKCVRAGTNVWRYFFKEFDNVYVSFSVERTVECLLNLCIDYIRRNNLKIKLGVFLWIMRIAI